MPHFFKHFWNHRMALDKRNYRQLVDTTVEIANRVGASEIINRLVDDLKDENENYRKMVMESIEKIMGGLGSADVDSRLDKFNLNLDRLYCKSNFNNKLGSNMNKIVLI